MRFTILEDVLSRDPNRLTAITELFDRLHRDVDVNKEPLFWLQYSILMTAADNLPAAENFIRTAYARAAASPGFQTFQIDTYALRLLLTIEERVDDEEPVKRFDEILGKIERVRSMVRDQSRRFHAIQVLDAIEPFVSQRLSSFGPSEIESLIYNIDLLRENLDFLPVEEKAATGANQIRAGLLNAKSRLLARRRLLQ